MNAELPKASLPITKNSRLAVLDYGLQLQSRLAGNSWNCVRVITWPEVRAVYRYERRNWNPVGAAMGLGFVYMMIVAAVGLALGWRSWIILTATLGVPIVGTALALVRTLRVLEPMLRVDAYTGPLVVPCREPGFFPQIMATLAAGSPTPAHVPPTPVFQSEMSQVTARPPAASAAQTTPASPSEFELPGGPIPF